MLSSRSNSVMRNKQLVFCCSRVGTVDNGARPHAPKTARASKSTDGVASRIPLAARGLRTPNTLEEEGAEGSLPPCESRGSQCRLHRRSRSHRLVLSSLSLRERRCPRILDQRRHAVGGARRLRVSSPEGADRRMGDCPCWSLDWLLMRKVPFCDRGSGAYPVRGRAVRPGLRTESLDGMSILI